MITFWRGFMGAFMIVSAGAAWLHGQVNNPVKELDKINRQVESLSDLKKIQSRIHEIVEKVSPSVVALTSARSGASGSGVIVNKEGLILTAAHVVQGNTEMTAILPNGKAFTVKVLGANRTKDIAMAQLTDEQGWEFSEMGNSDLMKVGDHVVAMGHAGGYDTLRPAPVRFGRLLSKNMRGYITTDCALIGGDSGGPLFDMDGKVVGINSSIGQLLSANNHAGISALLKDWDRLKKGETWGRLNQNPLADPDSPIMGFRFGETRNQGVAVIEVIDGGPAKKAGFEEGDVLIAIGEEKVENGKDLLVALNRHEPEDTVEVTLVRAGENLKKKITLTRRGDFFR